MKTQLFKPQIDYSFEIQNACKAFSKECGYPHGTLENQLPLPVAVENLQTLEQPEMPDLTSSAVLLPVNNGF